MSDADLYKFNAFEALADEMFQIFKSWLFSALFDLMDDFHDFVVHRSRAAYLPSVPGHSPIDGVYFSQLAFFDVLKHAGLELCMFSYGYGDDEE